VGVRDLLTMDEAAALRRGKPIAKPMPHVLVQAEKVKTKAQQEKAFRDAVWTRDASKSRASGRPLVRSGTTQINRLGEVHHVLKRSTHPEDRLNPANGILLSKQEHALAETACPNAPDTCLLDIQGAADLAQPQTFIWRDVNGEELRRRTG
jgi:hypothetical protein